MNAEELNLMIPLVCDNPQWEHVKFSFVDSHEEVLQYHKGREVGYPRNVYDNLEREMLLLKAELVCADKESPKFVFYERVWVDLDDTSNLANFWRCRTDELGSVVAREAEGFVLYSYKWSNSSRDLTQRVEYTIRDLASCSYYTNFFIIAYVVDLSEYYPNHSADNHMSNPFEIMQRRVVKEYLQGKVTIDNRADRPMPNTLQYYP